MDESEVRARLEQWYQAAVAAVDPAVAMRNALATDAWPSRPPAILAMGKAAAGMATGAVQWLAEQGLQPIGGLIVSHAHSPSPHPSLTVVVGDHPLPGDRSLRASEALANAIQRLDPGTPVMVLLSGGASSLIGAPLDGITPDELRRSFLIFHELGFEIGAMNALRRRLTRWGGGRLGSALHRHEVRAWLISDVIGNDLATIGSGPLVSDSVDTDHLIQAVTQPALLSRLPAAAVEALRSAPPRSHLSIAHRIVADASTAAEGARQAIARAGFRVEIHRPPFRGTVTQVVSEVTVVIDDHWRNRWITDPSGDVLVTPTPRQPVYHVWTGEATLELPRDHGHGGRAQQMALMLSRELARMEVADPATVLVAGTDGRDGPTDAAGAVVDGDTAGRIAALGIDIDAAITRADSYPALEAVGALLRTGSTGTNVADIVIAEGWSWY